MSIGFDLHELHKAISADAEFNLASRYWTGRLELLIGETAYSITLIEGRVVDVAESPCGNGLLADGLPAVVRVAAPQEEWINFLRHPAPPFYLDFSSASRHHGFEIQGDRECFWAYFPAIRRAGDILREIHTATGT